MAKLKGPVIPGSTPRTFPETLFVRYEDGGDDLVYPVADEEIFGDDGDQIAVYILRRVAKVHVPPKELV